jgi:hypothetical protein
MGYSITAENQSAPCMYRGKVKVASLSELPADLKDHARQVPEDVFRTLHQGEAEHRLRHYDSMLRAADSLPAEQYRHVTARARRIRDAMPYKAFTEEHQRLSSLKDDARRNGHHDIANAWGDALGRLERDHEQAEGTTAVGSAIMAYDKANQDVSKTAMAAAVKAAAIQKAIEQATADFRAKQDSLWRDIQALKEEMSHHGQR